MWQTRVHFFGNVLGDAMKVLFAKSSPEHLFSIKNKSGLNNFLLKFSFLLVVTFQSYSF